MPVFFPGEVYEQRIPWTGGLQSMGHNESDLTEQLSTHSCMKMYLYIQIFTFRGFMTSGLKTTNTENGEKYYSQFVWA